MAEEPEVEPAGKPDMGVGLAYWTAVAEHDRSNNAVLGGFGNGSLPRVDALGSRLFLLTIRPELSKIEGPCRTGSKASEGTPRRVYRALDVGAGIGRVTADVLLYLFERVDLVEPVAGFIETAQRNASSGRWLQLGQSDARRPQKAVRFWRKPIQEFDPSLASTTLDSLANPIQIPDQCSIVGPLDHWNDGLGYDLIWAQWTLGHLSDEELVEFLKKCKRSLRAPSRVVRPEAHQPPSFDTHGGLIIVKENIFVSKSDPDGDCFLFDKEDSSLTRSHQCFLRIFRLAGLELVHQDVQKGFDPDLYKVNFYALR